MIVGAHLDSVVEGPGINDNGSGTAALLEIGQEMAKLKAKPRQRVRFAFWGAEESGLLGSTHYVESLNNLRLNRIKANLNFDMIGSPNFVRFVYDGNGSAGGPVGPPGSAQIERIFNRYFSSRGSRDLTDRLRRALRLRPVHRGGHPCRWALHAEPRVSRHPRRPPPTAGPRVRRTTPATTRRATTSPT